MKKEISSLRTQNLELQKSKTTLTEKVNTLNKTNDFYQHAHEEADQKVKQLQKEKDQSLNNQLVEFKEENVKLKQEIDNIRKLYEKSLMKVMSPKPNLRYLKFVHTVRFT